MVRSDLQQPVLGTRPLTHRLPFRVMWGITFLTATVMAVLNFCSVFAIEYTVMWKFQAMQWAVDTVGVVAGTGVLVLISMFYASAGVLLIERFSPVCGGSGLPENRCYLNGSDMRGFFTGRTLVVRTLTSILANAAGFPVGREGPSVTIGSNVAYLISNQMSRHHVAKWVSVEESTEALIVDRERSAYATRIACAVGGACGMAMIFNSPIGGMLYMFEEITVVSWPLELTFRTFVATTCAALMSHGLLDLVNKDIRDFVIFAWVPDTNTWEWDDVPYFIVLAAIVGVITSLHTRAMLATASFRKRLTARLQRFSAHAREWETVFYCAICALVSVLASIPAACFEPTLTMKNHMRFHCPEGMYNPVASLLINTSHSSVKMILSGNNEGDFWYASSGLAFVAYFALNVGLSGLPVPGGAFTATMLLGGLFGRAVGSLLRSHGEETAVNGVYAVIGCAAMLCGFKQMTAAVVLIVIQCVNNVNVAPVVMLSVWVSMAVNHSMNPRGHDEEQILRKKLPYLEGEVPEILDDVLARDVCDDLPDEARLPPMAKLDGVRAALNEHNGSDFPVVDSDTGHCVGIIRREYLEAAHEACQNKPPAVDVSRLPAEQLTFTRRISDPDAVKKVNHSGELPLAGIMDPTPFTIMEDMPAPRFYKLFSQDGERAACVISKSGQFVGVISRRSMIRASRDGARRD